MKNLKKVSLCLLLVLSLMLGFVSCFSGSPSGGDSPDPSAEGSPNGSGEVVRTEPYINVFTEFPSGVFEKSSIAITYEAYARGFKPDAWRQTGRRVTLTKQQKSGYMPIPCYCVRSRTTKSGYRGI